ncbi:hypothetical protein [Nocardia brasiliensis]|uniref:WXG100-like domain-containing protein n=1 Tax=Nocardia brasiliensis TaxID=37326 RepID=UPI002455ED82|nr:hypothetical protein [Nocardia brasiliensis]
MSKLEVDPKVYYQAAINCFDAAAALNDSFKYVFGELNSCGQMAGRDEDGRAWAASYDESAREAVAFFDQTFATLRAYGTALNDIGFEHAKSDAALRGTTQPDRPQDAASTVTFGPYALPASAAGGTPQGLAKTSVEVLDAINCPLPDGNTDTLTRAADAWNRLGTIYQNTNAKDKITIAASLFDDVVATDAIQVREDLATIETSIAGLLDTCKAISKTCIDYKESIVELRNEIKGFIEAIIQEAAIDAAVTVVATCLTGVGGLIAGAKAVESARRWAVKIKAAVSGWRARKALQLKGLAADAKAALARGKKAMEDLRDRLRRRKGDDRDPSSPDHDNTPKVPLSNYKSTGMDPRYAGEEVPGNSIWPGSHVKYLTEEERKAYQLTVKDGKIYDATGSLFDTSTAQTAHSGAGRAIFVMDEKGNLYASTNHAIGEFHHSSFLGGKPVSGAGELQVVNGELKLVTDQSGHYKPSREYTDQVLDRLRNQGVSIDTSQVKTTAPN